MSTRRPMHRHPAPPLAPGVGLPKELSRLDGRTSPASLLAARTGVAHRGAAARLDALGFVCTPDISLAEALGAVAGTRGDASRIFLTEGTWHFAPLAQVVIARNNVELVSLSPGRTVFKRTSTSSLAGTRKYLLEVTGAHFKLLGVRIEEPGNADYPSVYLDGDYAEVSGCRFDTVYGAVEIVSDGNIVAQNWVFNNTAADALKVTSGTGNVVDGNVVI